MTDHIQEKILDAYLAGVRDGTKALRTRLTDVETLLDQKDERLVTLTVLANAVAAAAYDLSASKWHEIRSMALKYLETI